MGVANGMHGKKSHMYKIFVGEPLEKKHLVELDLEENIIEYYRNIILQIYFNKQDEKARIGLMWLQIQKNGRLSSTLKKLWVFNLLCLVLLSPGPLVFQRRNLLHGKHFLLNQLMHTFVKSQEC